MKIIYASLYAHLIHTPEESVAFQMIRKHFAWLNPDRYKIDAFRKGYWDGYVYMIDKNGKFLRGLVRAVTDQLDKMGVPCDYTPYELTWATIASQYLPLVEKIDLEGITLWEHQRRMTRELLRAGGGTVEGATGCGKTESIALLVRILLEYTNTVFFLVHRIGLMRGACERVKIRCPELAPCCGILGDGERPSLTDKIIFSTVQSLAAIHGFVKKESRDKELEKRWQKTGAVIIDEAHRVTGDTYLNVLRRVEDAPIYQFTGTPEVDKVIEDWTIIGVGGPIVTRVTRPEMQKLGFIAEAVACAKEFKEQKDGYHKRKIKWLPEKQDEDYYVNAFSVEENSGELRSVVVKVDAQKGLNPDDDETYLYPDYARDMLILQSARNTDIVQFVKASLNSERPVLILCEKIPQLYYLRGFLSRHLQFPFSSFALIHGQHSTKQRQKIVQPFEQGKIPILLASTIFDEGEDVKGIGSVVLAAGGASLVRIVQRIGRGVRAKNSTMGNYVPVWMSIDYLTKYSREHTEARLNYLVRAEITVEECNVPWDDFFKFLHEKYSNNITRVISECDPTRTSETSRGDQGAPAVLRGMPVL